MAEWKTRAQIESLQKKVEQLEKENSSQKVVIDELKEPKVKPIEPIQVPPKKEEDKTKYVLKVLKIIL